jgi:hypothetical protein
VDDIEIDCSRDHSGARRLSWAKPWPHGWKWQASRSKASGRQ